MKRKLGLSLALTAVLLAMVACSYGGSAALPQLPALTQTLPQIQNVVQPQSPQAPAASSAVSIADQGVLVNLFNQVNPGVVAIRTVTDQGGALGSGFVFDNAGHIVTNYHVVQGANSMEVDFPSGFKAQGNVVGTDLDSDIAVVKVDAPADQLHPLTVGNSDQLQVGQFVVAIGNPFGLSSSMSYGIVSALGRTQDSMHQTQNGGGTFTAGGLIQTDAAINPGNSGGPLFDMNGTVVGINRAIDTNAANSAGEPVNSGVGFAVPSSILQRVVPVLIAKGKYDYPYLGITALPELSLALANQLGIKEYNGAYVTSVVPGGPADKAGLKAGTQVIPQGNSQNNPQNNPQSSLGSLSAGGDLITAIDGNPIKTFDEMLSYLVEHKAPGDTVTLTILRGDQKLDVPVTLGARPAN
jgi:S1-C subfamily serine protease